MAISEGIFMEIKIDQSLASLGIKHVVIGIAKNVDPNAELSENFLTKQKKMEEWVLQCDIDEVLNHPYTQGYVALMMKAKRSVKKNPPTIPAFIRNIQHRGSIPHINSIVDVYNVESLQSYLAIGGHDLDKIVEPLAFTVSQKEDTFLPISSTPKHVAETDYIYRDKNGIMAWIGVRDGENYKFDDNTKNAIFIIQGNENTPVEPRVEALHRIESDLKECMPNLEFEVLVIDAKDEA